MVEDAQGRDFFPRMQQDIRTVRAEWLINEIDRSFKAWKENAYTRDMALDDFVAISCLIALWNGFAWIIAGMFFINGMPVGSAIEKKISGM